MPAPQEQASQAKRAGLPDSGTSSIQVKNLDINEGVTGKDLARFCKIDGFDITHCQVGRHQSDPETDGWVTYNKPQAAGLAIAKLNDKKWKGKTLQVWLTHERPPAAHAFYPSLGKYGYQR